MLSRADPSTDPSEAFTDAEITVLDQLSPTTALPEFLPRTLSHYTIKLAKLGGYLARKGDPPPGNIVMWRGLLGECKPFLWFSVIIIRNSCFELTYFPVLMGAR